MSYNAWLYVYANPVNLTDPSGYYGCHDTQDSFCRDQAKQLRDFALGIKQNVRNNSLLPVEGFAQIANKAESLFGYQDIRGTMWALTFVINGMDANMPVFLFQQGVGKDDPIVGYFRHKSPEEGIFYVKDLLPYKKSSDVYGNAHFERGDWRPEYWDGTANQAYHFWFYVGLAFFDNKRISDIANNYHDPEEKWNELEEKEAGISEEDWNLGVAGSQLGLLLRQEYIIFQADCAPIPHAGTSISTWIRVHLKDTNYHGGR